MSSDSYEEDVALLAMFLASEYYKMAGCTIFLYDYFSTLEQEITTIWPSRLSLGKALYFVSRYTTFLDLGMASIIAIYGRENNTCGLSAFMALISGVIGIAASEAILAVSLYALLGAKRAYGVAISFVFFVFTIPAVVIVAILLKNLVVVPYVSDYSELLSRTCWYYFPAPPGSSRVGYLEISYCILLAGELGMTIIAVTLGFRKYRRSRSSLMVVLYRDGSFYYIALMTMTLLNVLTRVAAPPSWQVHITPIQRALHPILANRLLLHMRKPTEPEPGTVMISGIQFHKTVESTQCDTMAGPGALTMTDGMDGLPVQHDTQMESGSMLASPVEKRENAFV